MQRERTKNKKNLHVHADDKRQDKEGEVERSSRVRGKIQVCLKGKFSSGIEGALASTLNHDFNWKQLSEMIFKVYLSNIDSETAEI